MATLRVDVQTVGIERLAKAFAEAGKKAPAAMRAAIRHTGLKARTQMRRAMVDQTGLKARTINRALRSAMSGDSFAIRSRGGDISLKFFQPKETRAGVRHSSPMLGNPLAGAFTKGGRFPRRVKAAGLNGHVYKRAGSKRTPLAFQDSGVVIPREMVEGSSRAAFFKTVERELPARLAHELVRILG